MNLFTCNNTEFEPKVTVLMPVFNAALYLKDAIDSILKQTYVNFELILINDGSTDTTEDVILTFIDSRIFYYKNFTNLGLIKTLNLGLSFATGKYIARMDSDDIAHENRLAIQVNYLENHLDVGVCGSFIEYFGDHSGYWFPPISHDGIVAGFINGSTLCHPSVMLRSSVLRANNICYDENYKLAEDYYLWCDISNYTQLSNIPIVLLKYRVNQNQVSFKFADSQLKVKNAIRLLMLNKLRPLSMIEQDLIFELQSTKVDVLDFVGLLTNLLDANAQKMIFNQLILKEEFSMMVLSKLKDADFSLYDLYVVRKFGLTLKWTYRMKFGLFKIILKKRLKNIYKKISINKLN